MPKIQEVSRRTTEVSHRALQELIRRGVVEESDEKQFSHTGECLGQFYTFTPLFFGAWSEVYTVIRWDADLTARGVFDPSETEMGKEK